MKCSYSYLFETSAKQALDYMGLKLFLELYLEASEIPEELAAHLFLSLLKHPGTAASAAATASTPQSPNGRAPALELPINQDGQPGDSDVQSAAAAPHSTHYARADQAQQHTRLHAKGKQLFGASE